LLFRRASPSELSGELAGLGKANTLAHKAAIARKGIGGAMIEMKSMTDRRKRYEQNFSSSLGTDSKNYLNGSLPDLI